MPAMARSLLLCFCFCLLPIDAYAGPMTPEQVVRINWMFEARLGPDAGHVAYVVRRMRVPGVEESGPGWRELFVVNTSGGEPRPFVTGDVNVGHIRWKPDGSGIAFLAKLRDAEHTGVWFIPIDGGESRPLVQFDTDIHAFEWAPDGGRIAFTATEPEDEERAALRAKGLDAEVYEEDWRHVRLYAVDVREDEDEPDDEPRRLEIPNSVTEFTWSPDGTKLAVAVAPTPLIDQAMMFSRLRIVDASDGSQLVTVENRGKLGKFAFSPDGERLAYIGVEDLHDPRAGRLKVVSARAGGEGRDLVPNYEGHIFSFAWRDAGRLMYVGHEGVWSRFSEVDIESGSRRTIVEPGGPILDDVSLKADGNAAAFIADAPHHPPEVYFMRHGDVRPRRLTNVNPWLKHIDHPRQEVVTYTARDGLRLEGILVRPMESDPNKRYPLILCVHGGPEGHETNGWQTHYGHPAHIWASRGYAVFLPNYRGSTGRGVPFSKRGQGDYAGGEFNDIVDAKAHLVAEGLVDPERVGVTGGSYGGYATAWCTTALSEHFAAGVMYMGISEQLSKFGTTDIPQEAYLVHARSWPWEDWEFFEQRSPIRHVETARTPLLIFHGKADTRVHPSQSLTMYRYLKEYGQAPVRLVLYPGEPHGNRRAASRYDYCLRVSRWFDHYLKGPGGDPPPPAVGYDLEAIADPHAVLTGHASVNAEEER